MLDATAKRSRIAMMFELQATRLQLTVRSVKGNVYRLYDERHFRELNAVVLPESFDFYRLRLNRKKSQIDIVVCEKHNAVLPVRCISMSDSYEYAPLDEPQKVREGGKRRNTDQVNILVSKLLLGFKSAYSELASMPERSRTRYLAMKESYLKNKVGRPWAS